MKKKYKKNIKSFFKRPLVILFLLLIAWALFAGLSTSFIISRVKREIIAATKEMIGNTLDKVKRGKTVLEDVEIYNKLKVVDLEPGESGILNGTIMNASDQKLTSLKVKIVFLNNQNIAINTREYDNVTKIIGPDSSVKFTVNTSGVNYVKAKGMVSDFHIESQ